MCTELDATLGYCVYTISDKDFFIDNDQQTYEGKTWSETKTTALIVPASSWAAMKSYILKQCKKHPNDCPKSIGL